MDVRPVIVACTPRARVVHVGMVSVRPWKLLAPGTIVVLNCARMLTSRASAQNLGGRTDFIATFERGATLMIVGGHQPDVLVTSGDGRLGWLYVP